MSEAPDGPLWGRCASDGLGPVSSCRNWLFAACGSLWVIHGAISLPLAAQQPQDTTVFRSYSVTFWVSDVRKSADFYHRVLGFPLVDYTVGQAKSVQALSPADSEPYGATFSIGGQRLILLRDVQPPKPSGVNLVVMVSDPAEYSAELRKRGVPIRVIAGAALGDTTRAVWFWVSDPDGHRVEFVPYQPRRPGASR